MKRIDIIRLQKAVALGRPCVSQVAFKPAVGAILVKDGKLIGQGVYSNPYSGMHAEIQALAQAGKQARGAVLYTSLEPCTWWPGKRTGSCAQALVKAGVKRVVIGARDPHPMVDGKGIVLLRKSGVAVEAEPPEARRLGLWTLRSYFRWVKRLRNPRLISPLYKGGKEGVEQRPHVLMKTAMSLDGKIGLPHFHATYHGSAEQIVPRIILSNGYDQSAVQKLRARMDAIMVGGHTLLWDEPRLTVRVSKFVDGRARKGLPAQPIKVAVIGDARTLSIRNRFFTAGTGYRILFTTSRTPKQKVSKLKRVADVYIHKGQRVNLPRAMRELYQFGIRHLMLEGGATLNYEMLKAGLVDELRVAVSPLVIGGLHIPTLVQGKRFPLGKGPKLTLKKVERLGELLILWYRIK